MNAEKPRPSIGPAESLLLNVPPGIRGRIIRGGLERILYATSIDYPLGYAEEIQELALNGHSFLITANHSSHADALPAAEVGAHLAMKANDVLPDEEKITGFLMPFALSMATGTQGKLLDTLFHDIQPILDRFGTIPVFTATTNDIEGERVKGTNAVNFTRLMISGVKEGKGIIIFPEGRVEAGRRDELGKVKGVQEFRKDSLQQALRVSTVDKDRVAVIPVGISGGYNVYDPQRKNLSPGTFLVGIGASYKTLVRVSVGMPMIFDKRTVRTMDTEEIDRTIGTAITRLLPTAERGKVYV